MPRKLLLAAGIFATSATLTNIFYINFCSFVFECGCKSLWAGAATACNVHAAHGRHCPWCAHQNFGYAVLALMLLPQIAISLQSSRSPWIRLAGAIAAVPAVGGIAALAIGIWDGYWTA